MNSVEPHADPKRGILLTDKVDMEWLKSVTPRFHRDFIKFVVDFETQDCYVGMDFHADCVPGTISPQERNRRFRGGNLFFADGSIVYESTLNIMGNLELGGTYADVRVVEDEKTIERIDAVVSRWVVR